MSPLSYIGAKLFYLGFRMQPLRVQRGVSLMLSIGIKWTDSNPEILTRIMNGEHVTITMDFTARAE